MKYYFLPTEYEKKACEAGIAIKTEYDEYAILDTDITAVDFKGLFADEKSRFAEGKRAYKEEYPVAYNVVASELPEHEFYEQLEKIMKSSLEEEKARVLNDLQ